MDILSNALHTEQVMRDTEKAKKRAFKEEAENIVAKLHAAFAPYEAQLQTLRLRGDYGKPVPVRGKYNKPIKNPHGLSIHLGSEISPSYLTIQVLPREDDRQGPRIQLTRERGYPYVSEQLQKINGFAPVEESLAAFFQALAKHVITE